ncbi:uncharacterized protein [Amphiura filiformis]|uniref:uncharacterized protein n=1 Tax=Amphiura filiformis TaxID=82378 RepID=UPI003B221294
MADLPSNRVKPDDPPFTYTGMDYFGPFNIKHGRKRYGVLFTCMNSRAVHIEIADSMDTSSCINALRRFLARRGHVKEITFDNGTNLVGASHQLVEAIKELDETALQRFASSHEIQWKFNTPSASHHGGVWERMIRTVRKILQALLTEQHIKVARSDDELHTLMCEVENTINSRPLKDVGGPNRPVCTNPEPPATAAQPRNAPTRSIHRERCLLQKTLETSTIPSRPILEKMGCRIPTNAPNTSKVAETQDKSSSR